MEYTRWNATISTKPSLPVWQDRRSMLRCGPSITGSNHTPVPAVPCQLRLIMSKTGPPLVVKDRATSGTSKMSPVVPVSNGQTQVVVRSTWATFAPLLLGAAAAPGIPTHMSPVMASRTAPSVDIVCGIVFLLSDANQWRVAPDNTRSASGASEIFPQPVQRSQLPRHHGRVARGPRG